jgi:exonuclease SbcD
MELFSEFYEKQNGTEPTQEQKELLTTLIEAIWEEEA